MSYIDKFMSFFRFRKETEQLAQLTELKLSSLIESIHSDLNTVNESIQDEGLKYIETFFDKTLSQKYKLGLTSKLEEATSALKKGDCELACTLLDTLKVELSEYESKQTVEIRYKPKMVSFDMPVLDKDSWKTKFLEVPLFALVPMSIPRVSNSALTLKIHSIRQTNSEIFMNLSALSKSLNNRKFTSSEPIGELTLSVDPTLNHTEVDELISHYKSLLTSKLTVSNHNDKETIK